jgi:hypothetical protein
MCLHVRRCVYVDLGLCVYICVYIHVWLVSTYVSMHVSTCASMCLHLCLWVCHCVYICVYVSTCASMWLHLCLWVCICVYKCVYLSICPCVYLSVCVSLSVRVSMCLCVCVCVCICLSIYISVSMRLWFFAQSQSRDSGLPRKCKTVAWSNRGEMVFCPRCNQGDRTSSWKTCPKFSPTHFCQNYYATLAVEKSGRKHLGLLLSFSKKCPKTTVAIYAKIGRIGSPWLQPWFLIINDGLGFVLMWLWLWTATCLHFPVKARTQRRRRLL